MEQHVAKLKKFFQQMRRGLSGHKSERDDLEQQIKKEVIDFKEQLEEQLEKDLIKKVEQFEKELLEKNKQLETALIEYLEQLETKRIVQEAQNQKETSGTLLYYALNKKGCQK